VTVWKEITGRCISLKLKLELHMCSANLTQSERIGSRHLLKQGPYQFYMSIGSEDGVNGECKNKDMTHRIDYQYETKHKSGLSFRIQMPFPFYRSVSLMENFKEINNTMVSSILLLPYDIKVFSLTDIPDKRIVCKSPSHTSPDKRRTKYM
jgi:hypothetical protein